MNEIVAVVFDWAGTMIDFGCVAPVRALEAAFAAEGVAITEAQARKDMGRAKRDHVAALLADCDVSKAWSAHFGAPPVNADVDRVYKALEPLMLREAASHTTLIPGAAEVARELQKHGIKIGSSTGYTRAMMAAIVARAAEQGYSPSVVVCADDTTFGRPSPLPMWKALVELAAYPAWRTVKVDDAVVGVEEGRAAGAWTVGIAASGNGVGLGLEAWQALPPSEQHKRADAAGRELLDAGAHYVLQTIADLGQVLPDIERRIASGDRP
ncbi:MAG TPA: phosphonoacetaldehyde hydrolase [Rhizomicrobium sp.]|jgi:phosphonoacetaldehyde hydrolase|nr:phosphonoacetaldehyde hydrolase [Rhizomicrobium sp.]